jgi:hypothetical protein
MFWKTIPFVWMALLSGCKATPDATTPASAFAMIGPCIDRADRKCFFRTLDLESRWSVGTIHRALMTTRRIVERSYPEELRDSAYGLLKDESSARTPEELFEIFCRKRRCMEKVARGFGAVESERPIAPDRVEIRTTRGGVFEMVLDDGRWGLDIVSGELQKIKRRTVDRLKQVEDNARQYDDQKLAREGDKTETGSP